MSWVKGFVFDKHQVHLYFRIPKVEEGCTVQPLSKRKLICLHLSWFGMNVMYLILSVEGETKFLRIFYELLLG